MEFSKNAKLEKALKGIKEQITSGYDSEEETISEIRRYKKEFPHETDYNFVQYGNALIYYDDIYEFYKACGYESVAKFSTEKLWNTYKNQVGYVIRHILES